MPALLVWLILIGALHTDAFRIVRKSATVGGQSTIDNFAGLALGALGGRWFLYQRTCALQLGRLEW